LVIITVIIVAVVFCCLSIIVIFYPRQSLFSAHTHTTHNNVWNPVSCNMFYSRLTGHNLAVTATHYCASTIVIYHTNWHFRYNQ